MQMKSKKRCVIISGSPEFQEMAIDPSDYLIACDDGFRHCLEWNLKPDLVVGDFDSFKGVIPEDIEQIRFKAEKDDTDTMLAAKLALEKGYQNIVMLGALGGRLDHTIANFAVAASIAQQRKLCTMHGKSDSVYLVFDREVIIPREDKAYLSVFAYSESVMVTYEGLKYPLYKKVLTNQFPLGVSNEFCEEQAKILVEEGMACIICSRELPKK